MDWRENFVTDLYRFAGVKDWVGQLGTVDPSVIKFLELYQNDPVVKPILVQNVFNRAIPRESKGAALQQTLAFLCEKELQNRIASTFITPQALDSYLSKINDEHNPLYSLKEEVEMYEGPDRIEILQRECDLINRDKNSEASKWLSASINDPALKFLLVDKVWGNSSRGQVTEGLPFVPEAVQRVAEGIESGEAVNPTEAYCGFPSDGWFEVRGTDDFENLILLSNGTGWCISGKKHAIEYLSEGYLNVLREGGRSVVAIRFLNDDSVFEIKGLNNTPPVQYFPQIISRLQSLGIPQEKWECTDYFTIMNSLENTDHPVASEYLDGQKKNYINDLLEGRLSLDQVPERLRGLPEIVDAYNQARSKSAPDSRTNSAELTTNPDTGSYSPQQYQ